MGWTHYSDLLSWWAYQPCSSSRCFQSRRPLSPFQNLWSWVSHPTTHPDLIFESSFRWFWTLFCFFSPLPSSSFFSHLASSSASFAYPYAFPPLHPHPSSPSSRKTQPRIQKRLVSTHLQRNSQKSRTLLSSSLFLWPSSILPNHPW